MRSSDARRCVPRDREGRAFDYRTQFQRDRDRILHSRAFHRLRLKSYGGAMPPRERYRDRMTHTLEVSQLSRTVARGLGLNEDLVEAIALGHELGTPPFGPASEAALASVLGVRGGGFRYSAQSLRVVDRLEKWYPHAGLNLTDLTREGILKHAPGWKTPQARTQIDAAGPALEQLHIEWEPFFEAQVVAVVDEVSTVIQDVDDGLRAGALEIDAIERLPIVKEVLARIGPGRSRRASAPGRGGLHLRAGVIYRGLTHMLVAGLIHNSQGTLQAWTRSFHVGSHEEFLRARAAVRPATIALNARASRMFDRLREFVERTLYQGAFLRGVAARARRIIDGLFRTLTTDPRLADDYLLLRFKQDEGGRFLRDIPARAMEKEIATRYRGNRRFARLVADHVAGMTDLFALAEYERLLGPLSTGGGAS
ncbi:MAG: dGTP triphosphohydrolase [Acidobacteriota bacterium]